MLASASQPRGAGQVSLQTSLPAYEPPVATQHALIAQLQNTGQKQKQKNHKQENSYLQILWAPVPRVHKQQRRLSSSAQPSGGGAV